MVFKEVENKGLESADILYCQIMWNIMINPPFLLLRLMVFELYGKNVDWALAEIASNTRPVMLSGSLQAVIKNHLLFSLLYRMSCTSSYRIMTNECTELV